MAPGESSRDRRQGSLPPVPGSRRRAGGEHKRALGPPVGGCGPRALQMDPLEAPASTHGPHVWPLLGPGLVVSDEHHAQLGCL